MVTQVRLAGGCRARLCLGGGRAARGSAGARSGVGGWERAPALRRSPGAGVPHCPLGRAGLRPPGPGSTKVSGPPRTESCPAAEGCSSPAARLVRLLRGLGFGWVFFWFFFLICYFWHGICKSPPVGGGQREEESGIAELESFGVGHYIMPRSALRSWEPWGDIPEGRRREGLSRGTFLQFGFFSSFFPAELCIFLPRCTL